MITKQTVNKMINKAEGNEFGSGKYYLYIYYGDGKAFEECECKIVPEETCLEVEDFDDQTTTWIPYSQITEMSIMNDIPDEV